MSCPGAERLAAAASDEAPEAAAHAATCAPCAERIARQRDVIERARRGAPPPLSSARRAALAAETLARADDAVPYRGGRIALFASVAAAAAIAMLVVATHRPAPAPTHAPAPRVAVVVTPLGAPTVTPLGAPTVTPAAPVTPLLAPTVTPAAPLAPEPAPAARPLRAASIVATGAAFERARVRDRDTIQLRDGTLVVDTLGRAPIAVVVADTTIAVANSRAKLVVVGGVIVAAQVFAGDVEVTSPAARATIQAGEVWTPPPGLASSFAAFRAGWEALRAGRHADAIAAFDLATDPAIAEDAAFWAAVAATRAGDRGDAARRLRGFLDRFPDSARADDARAALDRRQP